MPEAIIEDPYGQQLMITITGEHPFDDHWLVKLATPSLIAEERFNSGGGAKPIVEFLEGLAESWRGWDGKRVFDEVGGHFRLVATHDNAGHIRLWVQLGVLSDVPSEDWFASAPLELEAGGLESVARSARRLLGS